MKKMMIILLMAFLLFLLEFFLFNFLGKAFLPNLLLLLVTFTALEVGRYQALAAAVFAGFIKDSFTLSPVGTYMFSFVICAFLISRLQKYIFHEASVLTRLVVVLAVCLCNFFVQYLLHTRFMDIVWIQAIKHVLFPELIVTLLVAVPVFKQLHKCVLKSFV